ncbi:MAG: ribonuclease P protein component [Lachnospiraceae bacterium]|nr:ribonuclease P protein component [Lachnospiraceae bacterium]
MKKLRGSIRSSNDFKKVYEEGRSFANKYLVMYVLDKENDTDSRLGVSVSKKVGNSVVRHRLTRLVRESFRLNKDKFKNGLDIVVIVRGGALDRGFFEIENAFMHLIRLHKKLI